MEWSYVWWPWLTVKRVARVCRHQLRCLFSDRIRTKNTGSWEPGLTCWLLVQEMIIYAVFTLFFLGAIINCGVVAVQLADIHHFGGLGHYRYYSYLYPTAIVSTVMQFLCDYDSTSIRLQFDRATTIRRPTLRPHGAIEIRLLCLRPHRTEALSDAFVWQNSGIFHDSTRPHLHFDSVCRRNRCDMSSPRHVS